MNEYRKKPVVVSAIEWKGTNLDELIQFVSNPNAIEYWQAPYDTVIIQTLEGEMTASNGDFIIKGVNGEFYPCKPDIFWKTYDKV